MLEVVDPVTFNEQYSTRLKQFAQKIKTHEHIAKMIENTGENNVVEALGRDFILQSINRPKDRMDTLNIKRAGNKCALIEMLRNFINSVDSFAPRSAIRRDIPPVKHPTSATRSPSSARATSHRYRSPRNVQIEP
jgi:hypothetical protein